MLLLVNTYGHRRLHPDHHVLGVNLQDVGQVDGHLVKGVLVAEFLLGDAHPAGPGRAHLTAAALRPPGAHLPLNLLNKPCLSFVNLVSAMSVFCEPVVSHVCLLWTCCLPCLSFVNLLSAMSVFCEPDVNHVCLLWTCCQPCLSFVNLLSTMYVFCEPVVSHVCLLWTCYCINISAAITVKKLHKYLGQDHSKERELGAPGLKN